ncbi:Serine protease 29 [Armadillidium nasatum]|uniref:Serine protease 29 n=1 Tax=Armadillidium nasatum TaxID=96803 RepID=A0A5N5TDE6_9CRUS|nr:Serine protease 29 [Armadillidium nasatum]
MKFGTEELYKMITRFLNGSIMHNSSVCIANQRELPRNSIFKSAKINNPDGRQFETLPRSIPLSEKNSNYKVPVTIPLYYTPSLRFKRRIYRNFNSCSQLTYSGYNLDSFIIQINPKTDDIYTYKTRESSPLIDRGHIFSRPKKNVAEVDESRFVTSASSTKFKIDHWEYPYPNVHPTHPPIITHPPEHTNKPWWTTRSPLTTTTEKPSGQHDWWEIRKTDKPNWWQQQTTTPRSTLPPLEEGRTTRRPNWWQLDTTRWWVQRYTTSSPKTTTWQRHFTTSTTTTTTTTTPTTTTTTTTTTRPSLDKVEAYCLPSFYKKAKNLPVFGKEEKDEGEATRITGGTKIYPHSYPWIVSGNQLDTPRKVDLRIWSNEDCRLAYGPAAPGGIISSHLCAGKIGKDACSGDSGGPIMKDINGVWMQIGIVSWGIGCGKGHYPGVYSRISTFLPWIRKVQLEY